MSSPCGPPTSSPATRIPAGSAEPGPGPPDGDRRAERARLVDTLVAARGAEAEVHPDVAPGYGGTAADVARRVVATRAVDGWAVALGAGAGPPLDAAELTELRLLLAAEAADPTRARRRHQLLPPPVELLPEDHVAALARAVGAVGGAPGRGAVVAALCALPPAVAGQLPSVAERVSDSLDELESAGTDLAWARHVVDGVLSGRTTAAWGGAVTTLAGIEAAREDDRRAGSVEVRSTGLGPDALGAAADTVARFAEHLDGGGTLRSVFRGEEQRDAEAVLEHLQVAGTDPRTGPGARAVAAHLRVAHVHAAVSAGFAPLGLAVRPPEPRGDFLAQVLRLRETCRRIGAVLQAATRLRELLGVLPAERRPRLESLVGLDAVSTVALDVSDTPGADSARHEIGEAVARLEAGTHPSRQAPELRVVVDALRRLDLASYTAGLGAVDAARGEQLALRRGDELAAQLAASAPGILAALRADPRPGTWIPREERFDEAWAHARALRWLARRADADVEEAEVRRRIAEIDATAPTGGPDVDGPDVDGPDVDRSGVDGPGAGDRDGEPGPLVAALRDALAALPGVVVRAPGAVDGRHVDLRAEGPDAVVAVEVDAARPVGEPRRRAAVATELALRARGRRVVRVRESEFVLDPPRVTAGLRVALGLSPVGSPPLGSPPLGSPPVGTPPAWGAPVSLGAARRPAPGPRAQPT